MSVAVPTAVSANGRDRRRRNAVSLMRAAPTTGTGLGGVLVVGTANGKRTETRTRRAKPRRADCTTPYGIEKANTTPCGRH